jgi:hypothetical protein
VWPVIGRWEAVLRWFWAQEGGIEGAAGQCSQEFSSRIHPMDEYDPFRFLFSKNARYRPRGLSFLKERNNG